MARFFVVGEQLMRHHRVAREAALASNELALHGFTHRRHSELIPPDARDDEIWRAREQGREALVAFVRQRLGAQLMARGLSSSDVEWSTRASSGS